MPIGVNDTYETLGDTLATEVSKDIDVMEVCAYVSEQSDRWIRYDLGE